MSVSGGRAGRATRRAGGVADRSTLLRSLTLPARRWLPSLALYEVALAQAAAGRSVSEAAAERSRAPTHRGLADASACGQMFTAAADFHERNFNTDASACGQLFTVAADFHERNFKTCASGAASQLLPLDVELGRVQDLAGTIVLNERDDFQVAQCQRALVVRERVLDRVLVQVAIEA